MEIEKPILMVDGFVSGGKIRVAQGKKINVVDITFTLEAHINGKTFLAIPAVVDFPVFKKTLWGKIKAWFTNEKSKYIVSSICLCNNKNKAEWVVVHGKPGKAWVDNIRGAAGGPPFIPLNCIEAAQITRYPPYHNRRISAARIHDIPNIH